MADQHPATLTEWYRHDGDLVSADEPTCAIETDKAAVDVPAPHAGRLRRLANVGDTVRSDVGFAGIDPV